MGDDGAGKRTLPTSSKGETYPGCPEKARLPFFYPLEISLTPIPCLA